VKFSVPKFINLVENKHILEQPPPGRKVMDKIIGTNARVRMAAAFIALLLTACGGGGGNGGTAPSNGSQPSAPVVQAPTITLQPAAQSVGAGQPATFVVNAAGQDLAYQWRRDGKDIAGANASSYTLDAPAASDDGAGFSVVVKNAGGSVTSSTATLSVSAPPAPPRGLSLLAGTLGGPGNVDGIGGRLAYPTRIALSPSGQLYVADNAGTLCWDGYSPAESGSFALRIVDVATGALATVQAASLTSTYAIAFDGSGNLYESDWAALYRTAPGGQRTLLAGARSEIGTVDGTGAAARFTQIKALAADAQGNVYVAEAGFLRKVTPQGVVTTVAGGAGVDASGNPLDGSGNRAGFAAIAALAIDAAGNLQVLDGQRLRVVTPAGAVTTRALRGDDSLANAYQGNDGIAVDRNGNVYVTSTQAGCRILKVAADGLVSTLAGKPDGRGSGDGKGTAAAFCKDAGNDPLASRNGKLSNLALDAAGNLYVADTANMTVRRIAPDGTVATIAGRAPAAANADGFGAAARFVLNTDAPGTGTQPFAAVAAYDLAADAQGNFYVRQNDRIRTITAAGNVRTLAPQASGLSEARLYLGGLAFGGRPLAVSGYRISRIDADGSLALLAGGTNQYPICAGSGAGASFYSPAALVGDAFGNVYLQDAFPRGVESGYATYLCKITAGGAVTTVNASFYPGFAAADGSLWYVSPFGQVTRLDAGGTAATVRTVSSTSDARVVAATIDRSGNLYVAWHETPNWYSVHKIAADGKDTVIAGTPGGYGVRLGAPGSLGRVDALAVGADGNVYVISENAVLRIVE
jgi:sugar lactone lactonase YvrE